jgi:hypothetical protein
MIKHVNKGDKFQPSAKFHNAVADMVNHFNGFIAGGQKGSTPAMVRVQVVNNTNEIIKSGSPVALGDYNSDTKIFQVRKVTAEDKVFACVLFDLPVKKAGTAILLGTLAIKINGGKKAYAVPKVNSYDWVYNDSYGCPVLFAENGMAVILVQQQGNIDTSRPFFTSLDNTGNVPMINITGGWANCNGDWFEVKANKIGVQSGYICLYAEFNGNGYNMPTFKYGNPASNMIPLAEVKVNGDSVSIVNYDVSTAVILETDTCAYCALNGK